MKDYITKEEFKAKLKDIIEKDQNVWCFLGALTGMIGLSFDKETTELTEKIIENTHK